MTARDLLADARALLGAASATPDPDLKIIYVGKSRSMLVQLRAEVDMFDRELATVEATMVPTKGAA